MGRSLGGEQRAGKVYLCAFDRDRNHLGDTTDVHQVAGGGVDACNHHGYALLSYRYGPDTHSQESGEANTASPKLFFSAVVHGSNGDWF